MCRSKGEEKTLQRFTAMFDSTDFRRGLEISFCQSGKGKLIAKIDGRQVRLLLRCMYCYCWLVIHTPRLESRPPSDCHPSLGVLPISLMLPA